MCRTPPNLISKRRALAINHRTVYLKCVRSEFLAGRGCFVSNPRALQANGLILAAFLTSWLLSGTGHRPSQMLPQE